ncbi:hypothetical protein ACHQM5_002320 [Ranunculus cassubicifolius]
MANRMKEDERNEKAIRGLLKLPANKRCINCNSLGPQYVCTNFWTFVCTTCSGIHREYTHRVKSVSMAKFTSQEVSALHGGGNERAREVYFKEWDPQRHSIPDSSNVERLRDFIRHVYVDRRYSGDKSVDKPPRAKMGERDESYDNRRVDTSRGGSRSPPYDDAYDRRNDRSRYSYDERRSPGYEQESRYGNTYKKSPVRFEVVDDRLRDDRFGNGRKVEEGRSPKGDSMSEGRSPNRQTEMPSPPLVRPVRDILGDNVPPLRVGEPPKANGGLARAQRTASSSSLASNDGASVELKSETGSLIDFNADPEPSIATSAPPTQSPPATMVQPASTGPVDSGNWASFDFAPQASSQPPAQAPSSVNTLEDLLSQLSVPASTPIAAPAAVPTTSPVDNTSMFPTSSGAPVAITNSSTFPYSGNQSPPNGGSPIAAPTGNSSINTNGGGQWPNMQQSNSFSFNPNDNWSSSPQFAPPVQASTNNQTGNSAPAQNIQRPSQALPSIVTTVPAHSEPKTNERRALPEDLFAMTYPPMAPVSVPGWHGGISPGMGYGLQYPTPMPMQGFSQPSKPTNPFDLSNEPTMVHAPSFPSMTSLQGALPNMGASSGLLRSSSVPNPNQKWLPPQSQSYSSPGQSPSYASALPPSAYMGQQFSNNMPAPGHQGNVGFGGETSFYGNPGIEQQPAGRYSQPATPPSSYGGGNPFG